MKGKQIKYTECELSFVQSNKTLPRKKLTEKFNTEFDRELSVNHIKSLWQRNGWMTGRTGCFKKENKPWNEGKTGYMGANKTSFSKGNIPNNTLPIGSIRLTKEGHKEKKIKNPNVWKQLRHIEWEKHNDPVPKGSILRMMDGDINNINIHNMRAVTRSENLQLNALGYNDSPKEIKDTIYLIAKVNAKKGELNKQLF